jgi:hypothetical protein
VESWLGYGYGLGLRFRVRVRARVRDRVGVSILKEWAVKVLKKKICSVPFMANPNHNPDQQ